MNQYKLIYKIIYIGLVRKHRGYERTNENGTERTRMEEIQNLVRISCVVRLAKLVV
jgi:hypothetical protein